MYNALRLRSKPIEKIYSEGRADPKVFGEMVLNTANSKSARLTRDILKDFRVLAKLTSFSNQIKAWSRCNQCIRNRSVCVWNKQRVSYRTLIDPVLDAVDILLAYISSATKATVDGNCDIQTADGETTLVTNDGSLLSIVEDTA